MNRAGRIAIQEAFGVFIDEVHGDYNNIVGPPISKLYDMIKEYIF